MTPSRPARSSPDTRGLASVDITEQAEDVPPIIPRRTHPRSPACGLTIWSLDRYSRELRVTAPVARTGRELTADTSRDSPG